MALHQVNNVLHAVDPQPQRTQMGTVGGDHVAPGAVQAHKLSQNILPFDPRITYFGGTQGGSWTLSVNAAGLQRFSSEIDCSTPGAQVQVAFTGPRIEVFGLQWESGGKFDVYIDGNLTAGTLTGTTTYIPAVIPIGQQVPPNSNQAAALNATTTTITASNTSNFPVGPGAIRIESEWITYTSKDATNFFGCVRGAQGTVAATHIEGTTIYAVSSTVDTYAARREYRRSLWIGDNLGQGAHTLLLQIRSDRNASSNNTFLRLECFTVGRLLGGTALNLFTQQTKLFDSQAMDANGNYGAGGLNDYVNTHQLVSILGITDDSHALTYQIDNLGSIWIHGVASTTYTNCYITCLYAQESL